MTRSKKPVVVQPAPRRFTEEFKEEAVQMLLDGHSPTRVADAQAEYDFEVAVNAAYSQAA